LAPCARGGMERGLTGSSSPGGRRELAGLGRRGCRGRRSLCARVSSGGATLVKGVALRSTGGQRELGGDF